MSFSQHGLQFWQERSLVWVMFGMISPLVLMSCQQPASNTSNQLQESKLEMSQMPASQMTQSPSLNSSTTDQSQTGAEQSSNLVPRGSSIQIQQAPRSTSLEIKQILSDLNAKQTDRGTVISLPGDVLFDFDKATIRSDAEATLAKINQLLSYYQSAPILIEGHTDSKGSDAYNQKLSEQRSQAVREYLVKQFNVPPTRIQTKGLGEAQPIAPNTNSNGSDNPTGRQQNRRVEVILQS